MSASRARRAAAFLIQWLSAISASTKAVRASEAQCQPGWRLRARASTQMMPGSPSVPRGALEIAADPEHQPRLTCEAARPTGWRTPQAPIRRDTRGIRAAWPQGTTRKSRCLEQPVNGFDGYPARNCVARRVVGRSKVPGPNCLFCSLIKSHSQAFHQADFRRAPIHGDQHLQRDCTLHLRFPRFVAVFRVGAVDANRHGQSWNVGILCYTSPAFSGLRITLVLPVFTSDATCARSRRAGLQRHPRKARVINMSQNRRGAGIENCRIYRKYMIFLVGQHRPHDLN
jgi:hypothetical protein